MSFHVGQKVVCIDNSMKQAGVAHWPGVSYPEVGPIYHIREIRTFRSRTAILLLSEIQNPPDPHWGKELGFDADRFRPLQERSTETGMSILRSLLNTHELVRDDA